MRRWRIERDYQELKQEIGLGHYEGRGWRGFHHPGSLRIAAYGFLVAQRGPFPPPPAPCPRASRVGTAAPGLLAAARSLSPPSAALAPAAAHGTCATPRLPAARCPSGL